VSERAFVAVPDLADCLPIVNDAGEHSHHVAEARARTIPELGQDRAGDRRAAPDVSEQLPKVRSFREEQCRGIDDPMELLERRQVALGLAADRADQLVAAPRHRLGHQVLLLSKKGIAAVEKPILRRSLQRPVAQPVGAEHFSAALRIAILFSARRAARRSARRSIFTLEAFIVQPAARSRIASCS
jgi:hypothetical protein